MKIDKSLIVAVIGPCLVTLVLFVILGDHRSLGFWFWQGVVLAIALVVIAVVTYVLKE